MEKKLLFLSLCLSLCLSLFSVPTYAQLISDGLHVYYKFDNTLQDESIGNDLFMINSGAVYNPIYQNDEHITFSGNSSLSSNNNLNTNSNTELAISLWVKTAQVKTYNQTILQGAYLGFGIHVEANTGKIGGFFNGTSTGAYSGTVSIADNEWHHIVFQCDGSQMEVYIDSVLDGTLSSTLLTGNNHIFIGNSNSGNNAFFGAVNELRIYDRILSQCEINELHRQMKATIDASNGAVVPVGNLILNEKKCSISMSINSNVPDIKVYPNPPIGNNFTIEFENIEDAEKVETIILSDLTGRKVKQEIPTNQTKVELNLEGLKGSIFYITIYAKNGVETKQLIRP